MKIVLTERVTDLKWSDCTYLQIKSHSFPQPMLQQIPAVSAVSYQLSQNTVNSNAMQMNQHSSHQSYYAQDAVPQYSQSYIHSQLSPHYHYEYLPTQLQFLKTIYYQKVSISKSINICKKSQSLKPNNCYNAQVSKIKHLIHGFCRKTSYIPADIINLFIKYHGRNSNNTKIIRPFSDGFYSIDYRTLNIIHYAPLTSKKRIKKNKKTKNKTVRMKCVGHNVILSDNIIKSHNFSHITELNAVFFESKAGRHKYNIYHVVIFNQCIAYQLNLPQCVSGVYKNCNSKCLYSSKYGFLLLRQNNIQCFSLKHWKWSVLANGHRSIGFQIPNNIRDSSIQMIGEHKLLITLPGRYCMIFDLSTLNVSYTKVLPYQDIIGRKPEICYDDIGNIFYVYRPSGYKIAQYYDMTTCKWHSLENSFNKINVKFDSIWIDDVDKNLLYASSFSNKGKSLQIHMLDLRTRCWRRIF